MRVHTLAVQLGLIASTAVFAACGGGEPEPANETASQTPAGAPASEGPAGGAAAPTGDLPEGVTAAMVAQGQQVFHGNGICFTCHGQNGSGSPLGPNLADNQWLWITPGADSYQQLVEQIRSGTPQPKEYPAPMPPMGGAQLNDEQLNAVAAYVYSLGGLQGS